MPTTPIAAMKKIALDLHPAVRADFQRFATTAAEVVFMIGSTHYCFAAFEGYRSPERQHYLFTVAKTTKARPWQSAHQYGLAVDFACLKVGEGDGPLWSWSADAPWKSLKVAASFGPLNVPIAWDKGHVQHHVFDMMKKGLPR